MRANVSWKSVFHFDRKLKWQRVSFITNEVIFFKYKVIIKGTTHLISKSGVDFFSSLWDFKYRGKVIEWKSEPHRLEQG